MLLVARPDRPAIVFLGDPSIDLNDRTDFAADAEEQSIGSNKLYMKRVLDG